MSNVPVGHGGSYRVGENGEVTQAEAPTQDHPEGNRPRNSDGKALHLGEPVPEEKPAAPPEPAEPPAARRRSSFFGTPPASDKE